MLCEEGDGFGIASKNIPILGILQLTSVNPVHNAPVPPPHAVTYFGPEATSPPARLL